MSLCSIQVNEIFPTKWSLFIFVAYMMLFVQQGILVKSSQSSNHTYDYNVVSVILCSELLKLIICVCFYLKEKPSPVQLISDFRSGIRVCFLYMIPAFLYCLYNNLSFVNLANYDPTTYFILLQFRNVVTGVFYQILFRKKLTRLQWFSLVLLTAGCIVKEMGRSSTEDKSTHSVISIHLLLIMVQVFCSCFAGVYNEYLLKDVGSSVHILMQNIYMYVDSILCNLLLLFFSSSSADSQLNFSFLTQPIVQVLLVNGALAGITTSFFLKSLNSILKSFAATLEIIITAVLCYFIFGTSIDIFTVMSIVLICIAILIYSSKPVSTSSASTNSNKADLRDDAHKDEDLKVLIAK